MPCCQITSQMNVKAFIIALAIGLGLLLSGCGRPGGRNQTASGQQKGHSHDHEGHDHDHDHGETGSHDGGSESDELPFSAEQAKAVGLTVSEIQPVTFAQVIRATGELVAPTGQEAVVSATASGIVSLAGKNLDEGAALGNGTALAYISARNIADGDPQAKLRAQYEVAERAFRRAEKLLAEQLIAQRAFEEAQLNFETAKAAYGGLQPASSGAGIRITSPMSGFLKSRMVEEGAFVSIGQPLFTVTQNKRLRLRADVSQRYRGQLAQVRSANFKLPYDETVYALDSLGGQLVAFGVATESGSAFLPISFELNNTGAFPTGTYVEVFLLTQPVANVLAVPKTALIEEQGTYAVMVQTAAASFRKQPVTIGGDDGLRVQVLSGLQPGDRVATTGGFHIKLANMGAAIPHGHSH